MGSRCGSSPPSYGGVACGPPPWPPLSAACRHPSLPHARPPLFGSPGPRARSGRPLVGQSGGGGGGRCVAPPQGLGPGPVGQGRGVALPRSVSPPFPDGHQGGPLCHWPALHTAPAHVRVPRSWCRPRDALAHWRKAAGLLRPLRGWAGGCLEARGVQQRVPQQWRHSLGVAALSGWGVSPRAWRGGCGAAVPLAGLWLSLGRGGGEGGRGGGRGAPRCPPPVPWCCSPVAAGGKAGGLNSGGPAVDGEGGGTPLLLPSTLRALGRRAGPQPQTPRSPRCCRLAAWYRWGGGRVPSSPEAWSGGPEGREVALLRPSLCFPWAGTKSGVIGVAQFVDGMASILLWFVFAC